MAMLIWQKECKPWQATPASNILETWASPGLQDIIESFCIANLKKSLQLLKNRVI
jgi:hypothetical protein